MTSLLPDFQNGDVGKVLDYGCKKFGLSGSLENKGRKLVIILEALLLCMYSQCIEHIL